MSNDLFRALGKAQANEEEAAEAEAAAKLKMIKTRRAANRAQEEHDRAYDRHREAQLASSEAFARWNAARAAAPEGGA